MCINAVLMCRLVLPLPEQTPMTFAALPEYYLDDIADFILFIIQ